MDTTESYHGFGSFHSANVEDLIHLPDAEYRAPDFLPDWARRFPDDYRRCTPADFGAAVRRTHWRISPEWTFVNHGAFGGALVPAMAIKRRYEDLMEEQPLRFVDRTLLPLLVHSTRALAGFIHARPQDVALVENATVGLNAAISSMLRHAEDKVVYLDSEYGSVWKMMRERCNAIGCTGQEVPLLQHLNNKALMSDDAAITAYLEKEIPNDVTVMVLDHVSSNTALLLPVFTHIIPMLWRTKPKLRSIVVDGAHGPMQFDLNFNALTKEQRPSLYVGNLHKWFSCPKSVGFVWADPAVQKRTHSVVVSHGSRAGFVSEFIWAGTKDYGAYLTIPAIVDFWTNVLPAAEARRYASTLLMDADRMLCAAFKTTSVPRGAPFMRLVRLPVFFRRSRFSQKFIQDTLHDRFNVESPIKDIDGVLYVRVSAYVNNTMADYEKLRDAILEMERVLRRRQREDAGLPAAAEADGEVEADDEVDPSAVKRANGTATKAVECGGCGLPLGAKTVAFSDSSDDDS